MIKVKTFYSDFLKNKRKIYIFIPPGYSKKLNYYYPVLYMHDGQNLFQAKGTFPIRWNLDITLLYLIRAKLIQDIIVVGISNTYNRDDEYTPTFDNNEQCGGLADLYLKFLIFEVKNYIDRTYRVYPFREKTGICGSSLGGLVSLYAFLTYPEFFSKIGVMSPSIWWDNQIILKLVNNWQGDPSLFKIWLDMGFNEGDEEDISNGYMHPIEETRILCNLLLEKGFKRGKNLKYYEDYQGAHDEISWGNRVGKVLKFLFPRYR